jgi:parallel beta-helix repeat protein
VDNVYAPINAHAASHFNTITGNVIASSTYGMFYHNSRYNTIHGNTISHIAIAGIWLQDQVSYTTVTENTLVNSTTAIRLQGPHQHNIVKGNAITSADVGILLQSSATYTLVTENTICENNYGVLLQTGSTTNTFYYNNFLNNTHQVNIAGIAVSNWDSGCEGNYWSNYNGTDLDGDGIGDSPATIDSYNADHYPLMNPYWNPGDINHDRQVDIFDASLICAAYGAAPSWICLMPFSWRFTTEKRIIPENNRFYRTPEALHLLGCGLGHVLRRTRSQKNRGRASFYSWLEVIFTTRFHGPASSGRRGFRQSSNKRFIGNLHQLKPNVRCRPHFARVPVRPRHREDHKDRREPPPRLPCLHGA